LRGVRFCEVAMPDYFVNRIDCELINS